MRLLNTLLLAASLPAIALAQGQLKTKTVQYTHDGVSFESALVYSSEGAKGSKPGILMVPNWMGLTDAAIEKAKKIAGDDYVVMVVDMYGVDTRPANSQEASKAAGEVRGDRSLMRARAQKALDQFKSEGKAVGLNSRNIAAIGFCFGGGTALELGRAGADIDAIVSFHGDLTSPTLEQDASNTKAKVLVLHGADDPYVPQEDVQKWISVMRDTDVDWQLVQYSDTVHSFTNPQADAEGSRYKERSAERAFEAMRDLFDEIW